MLGLVYRLHGHTKPPPKRLCFERKRGATQFHQVRSVLRHRATPLHLLWREYGSTSLSQLKKLITPPRGPSPQPSSGIGFVVGSFSHPECVSSCREAPRSCDVSTTIAQNPPPPLPSSSPCHPLPSPLPSIRSCSLGLHISLLCRELQMHVTLPPPPPTRSYRWQSFSSRSAT